jgi:hypothetical protein
MFEDATFQSLGNTANITAKLIEYAEPRTGAPRTVISRISLTWRQQQGGWYLTQVRIVNPSSLGTRGALRK